MAYYEHTQITKQDASKDKIDSAISKYSDIINDNNGKIVKIEKWGVLNFSKKIRNYNKGQYIHFKFEGDKETIGELNKKIIIDQTILRHLTVKYKSLDLETEYFKGDKSEKEE